jgi:imidazolonepropionase-like amidohydrolase
VAEAHQRGKIVFTHPSNVAGLEVALRARVDVLAHAIEDTRGLTDDHLRNMIAQKMTLIPTLHLFSQDTNIEDIRREVKNYQQAGGQVLFGTDVGFLSDYDPTDEFIQMARAGLSWRQILASLTTSPAARFGEASRRGRVATGLDADLVVLGHDPATDVRAFADVIYVARGGRMIFQK